MEKSTNSGEDSLVGEVTGESTTFKVPFFETLVPSRSPFKFFFVLSRLRFYVLSVLWYVQWLLAHLRQNSRPLITLFGIFFTILWKQLANSKLLYCFL